MEYFVSHIKIIFVAAVVIAVIAIAWLYLLEKNAELKRRRAQERANAKSRQDKQSDSGPKLDH